MKGTYLGEFQEVVLLTILVLEGNAYGVSIQEEIEKRTGRSVSRGALHTALTRLDEKGFINSEYGGATAERGGRRKRFYQVTNLGKSALEEAKSLREDLWSSVPKVALQKIQG
ncbi:MULTISPECIES: helix-turn-helix transcriptional regulator [Roseivirga]|jgi:DNA-binding PadR family transcriptional regulator|uniref:PadR family transcriptional regulator n=1 Tax=Roseivirga spongicola TaxID=333140 RepID=A0A150X937_9BACT|nr:MULTISPECIES: helix-turn-helix transcriptional regulator [Roseivirga]PWL27503.1 MAG: PadR family transcriptional regulator [Roseivirga sp. XM-24bin3]KYG75245.1 PadR family transcriptional regulator [Roseivirga spongicola]MBO6494862.1 helix-turn-helix transcriptional regulator [Roseivirga sp.]MBO6661970.1 helix-turn-helix transcriptional regulator [Roseivirga sp.]MBO6762190.1 helix-turn-helix transcriptional regulator [Roseivirga sp.]